MEKDPRIKALTRATGIAKRTSKDVESYERELVELTAKLNVMISEGKDKYEIKQQTGAVEETRAVIPDCKRRKELAISDLRSMLENLKDLSATEEYVTAQDLVARVAAEE